jgi:hypothetical protein
MYVRGQVAPSMLNSWQLTSLYCHMPIDQDLVTYLGFIQNGVTTVLTRLLRRLILFVYPFRLLGRNVNKLKQLFYHDPSVFKNSWLPDSWLLYIVYGSIFPPFPNNWAASVGWHGRWLPHFSEMVLPPPTLSPLLFTLNGLARSTDKTEIRME